MIMAQLELGRTVSLTGILRECSLYLVGNPLITSEITDIRAGMLVPFRVELYADTGNAVTPMIDRHLRSPHSKIVRLTR